MKPHARSAERWRNSAILVGLAGLLEIASPSLVVASPQVDIEVSPGTTPEIRQIKPNQAAPGEDVMVVIEGRNFSAGAYVSFSNPGVHAVSTRRIGATQLEARVAVGKKAVPGTVSLFVSNPASVVAEAPFTILGGAPTPPIPSASATAGSATATAPPPPSPPAASTAEIQPSQPGTPEVARVDPSRAGRGSQEDIKITGKNFARGAKVAFGNPGIRVLETQVSKDTELITRVQIAPDASTGPTGLFVVNPDDRETEVAFTVTGEPPAVSGGGSAPAATSPAPTASPPTGPTPTSGKAVTESLRLEVISLGNVVNILQNPNKPKGTLTYAGGKLRYEEAGKEVFAATPAEIKEIDMNAILGVNTGTFHIILNSGHTFNLVPASLRPADSQPIIDALRKALK